MGIPTTPFVVTAHSLQDYTAAATAWNAEHLPQTAPSQVDGALAALLHLQQYPGPHGGQPYLSRVVPAAVVVQTALGVGWGVIPRVLSHRMSRSTGAQLPMTLIGLPGWRAGRPPERQGCGAQATMSG